MTHAEAARCDLEQELDIDLPAARELPQQSRSDFLSVVRTAVDRERAQARSDLDTKLAGRSALTRFVVRNSVLGRHK